ncbi:MAG TPA: EscU/YscU/HrcU family type III secretion system export apparatus switch protein [Beijerinckiaceae bacterium]|nr:EscU/YscU/HrcU family type III secretion system export apparatus switch protein [Beijerinckiaceae bacterium]
MAPRDTGEERNIWPTQRRLQRLRREGVVPRSRDFQTSISLLAVVVYLVLGWRSISNRLQAAFLIVDPSMPGGFSAEYHRVVSGLFKLATEVFLPIALVGITGALAGAIIDGRGLPVQSKALAPNFQRLSPAEGLKNLFSLRNLLDFGKGVLVALLVLGGNVLLFRTFYNDLMWSPSCGGACVFKVFAYLIGGSILIGLIIVLAIAFIDLPLARWQFLRENKMSVSEYKRELKEEEGDPLIRRARRQQILRASQSSEFIGVHRAQIVLAFGDSAVALTYLAGKTAAPIVAARTRTDGAELVRRGAELHLPIVQEPTLVALILESANVGDFVPNATFDEVARVLVREGIIRPPQQ